MRAAGALVAALLLAGCNEPSPPPLPPPRMRQATLILDRMLALQMTKPVKARKRPPIETCEGLVRHGEWARLRLPVVEASHGRSYPCGAGHVAYGAGSFWPVVAKLLVQQPGCERCTLEGPMDFEARDAIVLVHVHPWDEQGGEFEAEVDLVTPPGRAGSLEFVSAFFGYREAGETRADGHHLGYMTARCGDSERVAPECLRFLRDYVRGQEL